MKYPLYSDSLVTTLRFEKDKSDLGSPSVGYEVLIPKLFGKYKLDQLQLNTLINREIQFNDDYYLFNYFIYIY